MPRLCYGCMRQTEGPVCGHCGYPRSKQNESHQLPTGTVLNGRYLVGRLLGQGGFGITYLGWDQSQDSLVAIKEFYPNALVSRISQDDLRVHVNGDRYLQDFESGKNRFLREADALIKLQDVPEIVNIMDSFQANGTAYIVMEYIPGVNLGKYIQNLDRPLTAEETFRILKPVILGLAKVHRSNLVHRDVSPDNIMLHPTQGARLLDFGAVRNVESTNVSQKLAQSTEAVVKHGFAPIEQYQRRGGLGPWTDEYALCATIYYCLTARIPPEAPSRASDEDALDWSVVPGLTPQRRAALEKGMSIKARDRHGSVAYLYDVLYREELPAPPLAETVPDLRAADAPASVPASAPRTRLSKDPVQEKRIPEPASAPAKDPAPPSNKAPAPAKPRRKSLGLRWKLLADKLWAAGFLLLIALAPLAEAPTPAVFVILGLTGMTIGTLAVGSSNRIAEGLGRFARGLGSYLLGLDLVMAPIGLNTWLGRTLELNAFFICVMLLAWFFLLNLRFYVLPKYRSLSGEAENQEQALSPAFYRKKVLFKEIRKTLLGLLALVALFAVVAAVGSGISSGDDWQNNVLTGTPATRAGMEPGEVESIVFLDFTLGAPADAVDLSEHFDGSVLGWTNGTGRLTIAADGGINGKLLCQRGFIGYETLTSVEFRGALHTEEATSLSNLFSGCARLESVDADSLNVSNVKNMVYMFADCKSLKTLDISSWDVSEVENMSAMFTGCDSLWKLDLGGWDVSGVEDMSYMFAGCGSLPMLDLNDWNVANVKNMNLMFDGCKSLEDLEIWRWNVSRVESMVSMFGGCGALMEIDLQVWRPSSLKDITRLFSNCTGLKRVNLSGWDVSGVTQMYGIFENCDALETVSLYGWDPEMDYEAIRRDLPAGCRLFLE